MSKRWENSTLATVGICLKLSTLSTATLSPLLHKWWQWSLLMSCVVTRNNLHVRTEQTYQFFFSCLFGSSHS